MYSRSRKVGATLQQGQPSGDGLAVVPEVTFLHDKPTDPETEQRHPSQFLVAAIRSLVCALQGTAA